MMWTHFDDGDLCYTSRMRHMQSFNITGVECQTPGAGWDGGCKAPPSNRSLGITRRPVPQRHK